MRPPSCRARSQTKGRSGGVVKGQSKSSTNASGSSDQTWQRDWIGWRRRSRAWATARPNSCAAVPRINQRENERRRDPTEPASRTSTRRPASVSNSAAKPPAAPAPITSASKLPAPRKSCRLVARSAASSAGPALFNRFICAIAPWTPLASEQFRWPAEVANNPTTIQDRKRFEAAHPAHDLLSTAMLRIL